MGKKLISIVVPVYKVENEIDRCVQSILIQTYKNIEIILVDDGSPDNCPQICDEYAKKDNRVKVIHKENGGLSDARNVGLREAKGEYILYVDSDDFIQKNACEVLISFTDVDVDVVVGACKEIQKDKVVFQKHTNLNVGKVYTNVEYIEKSIEANEWYAPAWLNLYNRKFLIKNNLYYRTRYLFEDVDMLPKLFLKAKHVVYSGVIFYNYVVRDGSIIKSKITNQKKSMIEDIYTDWLRLINQQDDKYLVKLMRGALVKYYIASARKNKINGWKIRGMTFKDAFLWAINGKEKIKVILFTIFPHLYAFIINKG